MEVCDKAAYARLIRWRRLARESRLDGVFEFVGRSGAAGVAEILVQIINAAVIEELVICIEDSSFGRYLDLRLGYQRVLRIAQREEFVAVLLLVLADLVSRCCFARIDKPEPHLVPVL